VTETGTTTRTTAGQAVGHCPTPGRRPCRALSGGSPDGRAAAARAAGPLPQVVGTRRYAASMTAPARSGRGPSSVPGILSPRKITVKGAPSGRVCDDAKTAPPLTLIFPGKTIGTYRKDGTERGRRRSCSISQSTSASSVKRVTISALACIFRDLGSVAECCG
jgi:hypothetical protein